VNWIDTTPMYGDGQSEEALGWLLREVEARPHVSTKIRLDPARLGDSKRQIEDSLRESFSRLKCDSVTLMQLHNPIEAEAPDNAVGVADVLRRGGIADILERLRDEGLFDFIGITALGSGAACKEVLASGRFDTAQVHYNMLNPSAARAMPPAWSGHDFAGLMDVCRAEGVGVMNIRVLAAGVLASDTRTGREGEIFKGIGIDSEERRAAAALEIVGEEHGTRAQRAIRHALANPDIGTVIVGMAGIDHLEQALGAADLGPLRRGDRSVGARLRR
jgi:D-threo-aldose 1-dehydrogenase